MNRRHFVKAATGWALLAGRAAAADRRPADPTAAKLPRWRGFNLLEKFHGRNDRFAEEDFAWIAEWGFDFVRLPMDYRCWIEGGDWTKFREATLREVDEAVRLGQKHRVHVNLNFHRAPGYTVATPPEARSLWTDEEALRVCALHWGHFARRYQGIPNTQLSFNLLNEPAQITEAVYVRVAQRLVEAIRAEDARRLIIADGLRWGRDPVPGLAGLGIAQSTRGYDPMQLSHYQASWVRGADQYPAPTWPLRTGGQPVWDKARLRHDRIAPWQALEQKGVGVHVGEWGAFQRTPHPVVLAWMRDCLALWQEAGWGWALWNFRGPFGILDSARADVAYESFRGHKLDRLMLELLQRY